MSEELIRQCWELQVLLSRHHAAMKCPARRAARSAGWESAACGLSMEAFLKVGSS